MGGWGSHCRRGRAFRTAAATKRRGWPMPTRRRKRALARSRRCGAEDTGVEDAVVGASVTGVGGWAVSWGASVVGGSAFGGSDALRICVGRGAIDAADGASWGDSELPGQSVHTPIPVRTTAPQAATRRTVRPCLEAARVSRAVGTIVAGLCPSPSGCSATGALARRRSLSGDSSISAAQASRSRSRANGRRAAPSARIEG